MNTKFHRNIIIVYNVFALMFHFLVLNIFPAQVHSLAYQNTNCTILKEGIDTMFSVKGNKASFRMS